MAFLVSSFNQKQVSRAQLATVYFFNSLRAQNGSMENLRSRKVLVYWLSMALNPTPSKV